MTASEDRSKLARLAGPLLLVFGLVAVALAWALAARSLLVVAHEHDDEMAIARTQAMFQYRLDQLQERVRTEAWLMGEDPRLRSALATQGIDQSTILDQLSELKKPTGSDLVAVLSAQGRVDAILGDTSFTGMDLSTSRIVREAREKNGPSSGYWTLGQHVFIVGAYGIRLGDRLIAYVVDGYKVDDSALAAAHATSGTAMALVVGGKVSARAPADAGNDAAFLEVAASQSNGVTRIERAGNVSIGATSAIEGSLPPAHIVWLRPSGQLLAEYEIFHYLIWAPVLICMAIAILFAHRLATR